MINAIEDVSINNSAVHGKTEVSAKLLKLS